MVMAIVMVVVVQLQRKTTQCRLKRKTKMRRQEMK
jgi:hypothetical protein